MAYTTINKGSSYFNTILYTGDGSFPSSKTGVGFAPDFIWIKRRSATASHVISDIIRGTTKTLYTDSTSAELTSNTYGWVSSFNSDGFSVDQSGSSGENVNASGSTYCAWNWLANAAGVSNTAGTITSTVSANTTSGFSIVSWTGTGSNSDQTLGTGLSTALDFVIAKPRDSGGGTDQWLVYVNGVTDAQNNCLLLNSTAALTTGASGGTPNRGSTAGQLKLYAGTGNNQNLNASGLKYIAYCFHSVKGFSKFGSYTGNGSADGTFIYTGFKPAWVMIKQTSAAGEGWEMADDVRSTYNVISTFLRANSSAAESTNTDRQFDFLSNGIKLRGSHGSTNGSGATYIYACFAENPFVSSTLVPTTAR